jgi:predicted HicB family RNase H-like nuclease
MKNQMNYKDYTGTVDFDEKKSLLTGKVIGTTVNLTYSGTSVPELINSFHAVVDTYLKQCKAANKEPEHPFKGNFNVRVSPYIHKQAAEYAMSHDISLNTMVNKAIRYFLTNNKDE